MNIKEEMKRKVERNNAREEISKDEIDCPICKNKEVIYYLNEFEDEMLNKECECVSQRRILRQIKYSGLELEFKNKRFDNFKMDLTWQKEMKELAIRYVKNINDEWLFLYGMTGSGKTHLATAVSKSLIEKGKTYKYMQFTKEIQQLANARKNFNEYVRQDGEDRFNELTKVDVLYIDDFLKLEGREIEDTKSLVFDLINTRYNKNKITIITSEYSPEELHEYHSAVIGRIEEKCKGFMYGNSKDEKRNTRKWGNWR